MKKTAVCSACRKVFAKNRWIPADDPRALLASLYGIDAESLLLKPGIRRKFKDVEVVVTLCDQCRREKSQYFEGILQLRNAPAEVIAFVKNQIKKERQKGVFLTKTEKARNGLDLYITNKTFTRNVAHKVQKAYGGIIKTNETLFSHNKQTSKDLFRLTVLLELPSIRPGQVIRYRQQYYLVKSTGQKLSLQNLQTRKPTSLGYDAGFEVIDTLEAKVIRLRPHVEVLHPSTFEALPVTPLRKVRMDERVRLILDRKALIF